MFPPTRRQFVTTALAASTSASVSGWFPSVGAADGNDAPSLRSGGMPPDPPRELPRTGADLGTLASSIIDRAARQPFGSSFLSGRFANHAAFRQRAVELVEVALQCRPSEAPLQPEVVDRVDCGDYIRETIRFNSTPEFRVPGYLLIPKDRPWPAPAIVDLHSHGGQFLFGKEKVIDFGQNHPVMTRYHQENYDGRPTATALVRRGYVVITIDALMFGERRVMLDRDRELGWDRTRYSVEDVAKLNAVCRAKEATLVKALACAGLSWPGLVLADDRRTLDYLLTRPEVDPARVGCLGISMGGYRALYLAAMDPRIRAACVVGFMSTMRPLMMAHLDTHSFVHFPPRLHAELDWPDIAMMIAPRGLLVQQCQRDALFPLAGMHEAVQVIATGYRQAEAAHQFRGTFYDVPHRFTRAMQDDAFAWFDNMLKS